VWRNLLANALKYTVCRSEALIRVRSQLRDDGWVVTSVGDNGIGFDPAGAHRLFGVFERLHAAESGVGIGLAEVRRVVERHGGEVAAVGGIDRGATFTFTLPPASAAPRRSAREERTHP
jgi:two-component system, chemotaxis family, sensor kinase Cph1